MPTTIDTQALADGLGVTTAELGVFLREAAAERLEDAAKIAMNEAAQWYAPDDVFMAQAEIMTLANHARDLVVAACEFEKAWYAEHPDQMPEVDE